MNTAFKNPKLDKLFYRIYNPPNSEKYRAFKEKLHSVKYNKLSSINLTKAINNFLNKPSFRIPISKALEFYKL